MLVSEVQQNESVIHIPISNFFPYRLLQSIEKRSWSYTGSLVRTLGRFLLAIYFLSFLNNIFFSLAYLNVKIHYLIHISITYKISVN